MVGGREVIRAIRPVIIKYLEGKPVTTRDIMTSVIDYTHPDRGIANYRAYRRVMSRSGEYCKFKNVWFVNLDTELDFTLEAILLI